MENKKAYSPNEILLFDSSKIKIDFVAKIQIFHYQCLIIVFTCLFYDLEIISPIWLTIEEIAATPSTELPNCYSFKSSITVQIGRAHV